MEHASRRVLFVGGLDENVTNAILHAAFLPFGEVKDVQIPLDHIAQKHRGFGFVEFEEEEDAAEAMDNMNSAELFGRVIKVNIAKPSRTNFDAKKPIWAQADEWYSKQLREDGYEAEADVARAAREAQGDGLAPAET